MDGILPPVRSESVAAMTDNVRPFTENERLRAERDAARAAAALAAVPEERG